ncbi:MAG: 4Fe-4S binding protein [Candidatus Heimdallarchaeaceae archaeon]
MSETQLYEGKIPREEINWFPTVDENVCIGCGECAENCPAEVYKTPVENIAEVISPLNCVVASLVQRHVQWKLFHSLQKMN